MVIYNNLLLNHLWSCVLKLASELHDFMTGRETQREIERYCELLYINIPLTSSVPSLPVSQSSTPTSLSFSAPLPAPPSHPVSLPSSIPINQSDNLSSYKMAPTRTTGTNDSTKTTTKPNKMKHPPTHTQTQKRHTFNVTATADSLHNDQTVP